MAEKNIYCPVKKEKSVKIRTLLHTWVSEIKTCCHFLFDTRPSLAYLFLFEPLLLGAISMTFTKYLDLFINSNHKLH